MKTIVDGRWKKRVTENPDMERNTLKQEALKFRNAAVKEFLDAETEEVKAEVERRREEGNFSDCDDIEFDDGNPEESVERQRLKKVLGFQKKVFLRFF